jgi:hypothetical protein
MIEREHSRASAVVYHYVPLGSRERERERPTKHRARSPSTEPGGEETAPHGLLTKFVTKNIVIDI